MKICNVTSLDSCGRFKESLTNIEKRGQALNKTTEKLTEVTMEKNTKFINEKRINRNSLYCLFNIVTLTISY